ncbi:extracellular matrix protein 1 [Elgaria multicarinata webbii]|uniref:extracellular matrix protein 1 n=1 Tax=Elgaria multicarinata webbii TaxID=159646 RepID=UPI002FCCF748
MALKMLFVFLASWLVLANSATVAPKGDGGEERPPPPSGDLSQHEIDLSAMRPDIPLQKIMDDDLPFAFSPRGRRPFCYGGLLCNRQPPWYRLEEFPPARPTLSNIDNICAGERKKVSYGPWNLPQTGFSHLSRQGKALNNLEKGFDRCCRLPRDERLSCSNTVWLDALEKFCYSEGTIKTKPFHCCKLRDLRRELCFADEAPFPNYDFNGTDDEWPDKKPSTQVLVLPTLSFPPSEPTAANIKDVCELRKFRLTYPPSSLPQPFYDWFMRQARTINRLGKALKKCCRKADVGCAHRGWEKTLTQYCKEEFAVKDKRDHCCNVEMSEADYSCFASQTPYPKYNAEIGLVSLAEITPALLDTFCGQYTLLTKQRHIPALVQNITETCCKLQGTERTQCAEEVKSQFITALCGTQRNTWRDSKECCSQSEELARNNCFNVNYLASVPLVSVIPTVPVPSAAPTARPAEPAV